MSKINSSTTTKQEVLDKSNFKDNNKLSSICVWIVTFLLVASFAYLVLISVISVINKSGNFFTKNLIVNFVYIIVTLIAVTIVDYLFKKNKLHCKDWIACTFYIGLYIFLNLFNIFNLYSIWAFKIIAYLIFGLAYSVIAISVYYNYLKNSQGQVKAKGKVVAIFSMGFSIGFAFLLELVQFLISLIFKLTTKTIAVVMIEALCSIIGALVLTTIFFVSLKKTKKFINYCIIEID